MDIVRDVRKDVARFVGSSGACPEDETVLEAINSARRILYPLGDWRDTVLPIVLKCYCGFVTLPSEFEYLKDARRCSQKVQVTNEWFSVLGGNFDDYCGEGMALRNVGGKFVTFRDWPKMKRQGCKSCCPWDGFYVRVIHENANDCGVELTFHAIGNQQREVSLTRTLTGPWMDHDAKPGEPEVIQLTYVIKPKTQGRIRVYGYDGANTILLALYEPHEINPQYLRYSYNVSRATYTGYGLVGKAKKKYIPITDELAPVDIHTEALIHALQGITDRESKNLTGFAANVKLATDFLNRELSGPQAVQTYPMRMSTAYRVTNLGFDD